MAERESERRAVRAALAELPAAPARGGRARLLGRADRRPDRPSLRRARWARPRAASGSASPSCASSDRGAPPARPRWPRRPDARRRAGAVRRRRLGCRRVPIEHAPLRPGPRAPLLLSGREALGDVEWFDAHTHIGQNDPDGRARDARGDPRGARRGRPRAGRCSSRCTSPRGYRDGQRRRARRLRGVRRALRRARAGRARTPRTPWPRPSAACAAGARGRQAAPAQRRLRPAAPRGRRASPRSSPSTRASLLFHAGRGIPHLGESVVDLARRHPARVARAGPRRHQRPGPDRAGRRASCPTSSSTRRGGRSPTCCSSTRRSRPGRSSTAATCPTRAGSPPRSCSCAWPAPRAWAPRRCAASPASSSGASSPARRRPTSGPAPGVDALGDARARGRARGGLHLDRRCSSPTAARTRAEPLALAVSACQRTSSDGPAAVLEARGRAVPPGPGRGQPPARPAARR